MLIDDLLAGGRPEPGAGISLARMQATENNEYPNAILRVHADAVVFYGGQKSRTPFQILKLQRNAGPIPD